MPKFEGLPTPASEEEPKAEGKNDESAEKLNEIRKEEHEPEEKKEDEVETLEKKLESKFGKRLKCFRRWGEIGVFGVAVFILGKSTVNNELGFHEWKEHLSETLTSGELAERSRNDKKIAEIFGEEIVLKINKGDKNTFTERGKERKSPELIGFGEDTEFYNQYVFTTDYSFFPKNWINEVGVIKYINDSKKADLPEAGEEDLLIGGDYGNGLLVWPLSIQPSIRLYNNHSGNWDMKTIFHELAHANDWATDKDLTIIERQELLLKIHGRMTSSGPYRDWRREGPSYHEFFDSETKDGLYRSAQEYWADICAEYFKNPKLFQQKFPEDFKLVNEYVLKNDPDFDVFSDKGIFDSYGKVKEGIEITDTLTDYLKRRDEN